MEPDRGYLREAWEWNDRSFVALAGPCWKMLVNAAEDAGGGLPPDRFLTVRYEDFVAAPGEVLPEILEFGGLEYSERVRSLAERTEIYDASGKHRQNLTGKQTAMLDDLLGEDLGRYGYV